MSTHTSSACPHCGADAEIEYWEEYQGVRPHGGYVTRSQVHPTCDCSWSDDDLDALRDTESYRTKADRNFSPEEICGY